jgi:hypothetical protein
MKNLFTASFILLIVFSAISTLTAQKTGRIEYKTLGVSFTIPNGWVGQEGDGVFLMGSQTLPGLMLITTHEATSIEQLKQEAQAGFNEGNGTVLSLSGQFESVGNNGVGAEMTGTAEWQPAKGYVAGLVNPHGSGVTILVLTLQDQFTAQHKQAALSLAQSVSFRKPEFGPIVQQWKEKLNGVRLTYMDSYSSMDYSNPNYTTGGGYSTTEEIDLCPQGYFRFNRQSDMSVDMGGAWGNSNSSGQGSGTWKVIQNPSGNAVLVLNYYDGKVSDYALTMEEKKTMLNGYRYARPWTGENAPLCN